jgi:drug/metabolite transporter (DMT)-like permease
LTLEPLALALVLLAALMHAGWNAIAKLGHDSLTAMAIMKAPNMLVAAGVLAIAGLPAIDCWPYLLASLVANSAYFYFLINAYRHGDLSLAYPVARGLAPILMVPASLVAAREVPTAPGLGGIVLISAGVLALGLQPGATREHRKALGFAAGVALMIAIYTVLDGLGARAAGNAVAYVAVLNIGTGIVVVGTAAHLRGATFGEALRRDWHRGLLGGTMMLAGYTIVVFALTIAPMAQVAALRESSVVFAAIIGTFFLREPFGIRRILASAAVAAGIALLALGG